MLAQLGVTEEAVGAPIRATMEVVSLGEVDGIPLFLDRFAWEADGIVLVNRVKPHTDFVRARRERPHEELIVSASASRPAPSTTTGSAWCAGWHDTVPAAARALMDRANLVFGVALVENEDAPHGGAAGRAAGGVSRRPRASSSTWPGGTSPACPLDDIDLLILDEMGKDISGRGLDPNVTGRKIVSWAARRARPRVCASSCAA